MASPLFPNHDPNLAGWRTGSNKFVGLKMQGDLERQGKISLLDIFSTISTGQIGWEIIHFLK
jgi:hypothetical protein